MRRARVVSADPLRVHRRGDSRPVSARHTDVTVAAGDDVLVELVDRVVYVIARVASVAAPSYGNLLLRAQSNALDDRGFVASADTTVEVERVRRLWGALRVAATTDGVVTVGAATRPVASLGHADVTCYAAGAVRHGQVEARVGHRAFDAAETVVDQHVTEWGSPTDPTVQRWTATLPAETVAVQIIVQARRAGGLPDGVWAAEFSRLGVVVGVSPVTGRADWCAGGQLNDGVYQP